MLKILDMGQVRALDEQTIQKEPIASIDLMERACKAFVNWFVLAYDKSLRVGVVCGTGNNGGDGFVAARQQVSGGIYLGHHEHTLTPRTKIGEKDKRVLYQCCATPAAGRIFCSPKGRGLPV